MVEYMQNQDGLYGPQTRRSFIKTAGKVLFGGAIAATGIESIVACNTTTAGRQGTTMQVVEPVILQPGDPNTMTLDNGEVIYDLNGLWKARYNDFGSPYSSSREVSIKQTGSDFLGIKSKGGTWVPEGHETIKGTISGSVFKEVYGFDSEKGWMRMRGKITDNGEGVYLKNSVASISLNRK